MEKNQDPYVDDSSSPKHTPLNEYFRGHKWRLSGIIGDASFAFNATADTLIPTGNVSNKQIKVGDHVGMGNLRGRVTKVFNSESTPTRVVGLQVLCKSPYLPVDYKGNHEEYGYKTEDSILYNVILEKDGDGGPGGTTDSPLPEELKNLIYDGNTTSSVTYLGNIVVFKQHTDDVDTWTKTAQDLKHLQDKG